MGIAKRNGFQAWQRRTLRYPINRQCSEKN